MITEIIAAGLGVIAAGTTTGLVFTAKALFTANKSLDEAFDRVMATTKTNSELSVENSFVKANNAECNSALKESQSSLEREKIARKYAEGQRDELLKKMLANDPDGKATADAINDELRALQALMPSKQDRDSKGK